VSQLSGQCGILNILQPYRPPRPVTGIALLFFNLLFKEDEGKNEMGHSVTCVGLLTAAATTGLDLLSTSADDLTLLNEILGSGETAGQITGFGPQWEAVFGTQSGNAEQAIDLVPQWDAVFSGGNDSSNSDQNATVQDSAASFLPSQLLDQFTSLHTAPSKFAWSSVSHQASCSH
jgi:hypothetical protein